MTTDPAQLPWPEPWAVQAFVEADRIQHRMRAATAGTLTEAQQVSREAVESHVVNAREACRRGTKRKRGTSIELAYMHLHAAKIFLVDLLPDAEFEAVVPEATARIAMVLSPDDPRRVEAERVLNNSHPERRRAALKQVMETAYDARDEEYVRLRDFRNIILLTAIAILLTTGLLVAVVALFPNAIPMCFEPGVTTAVPNQPPQPSVCPSGEHQQPTGGDILIVAALGAVGGFLGALIAIRNLRGTSTPYSVSTALAVLKVPAGALSAIIGILLLSGGFVPGLTNLDNQRQILAYALLLGIAQQLVTRVADDRAQQILDHLPSKESHPEAKTS
ncbi:hypothetical protein [Paractinoplanes atraurantiacus]|uniref:Uncharacterized protein n=1 Tax=Paractinoplanes atraurantiacus TaxID=1036182 RepID=A0A285KE56_9ACTN|nr:hypothetical protein [Actinoplanes atraurantiacus]SNY69581.1 hypothetical protein SAMN05421748_13579 [Actinoplanes atraurantiacus]